MHDACGAPARRARARSSAPPPRATTPPSARSSSAPVTTSSSRARNAASPSRSKKVCDRLAELGLEQLVGVAARRRGAPPGPRVDLPAPMKPMRTSGFSAAATRSAPGRRATAAQHVVDVVAAELLAVGVGQHEGDHRLAHDPGGRHRAGVGALAQRLRRARGWRCRPSAAAWSAWAAASCRRARRAARRWSCRPRGRPRGWSRGRSRAPRSRRSRRGPASPGAPARSKPSPIPTPFMAWIEQSAWARRPSRRSSQETCEPSPGVDAEGARPRRRRRATRWPCAGR